MFFNSEILWQELEQRRPKKHHLDDFRRSSFDASDDATSTPTDQHRKEISPAARDERVETSHNSLAESGAVCFYKSF